MIQIGQGSLMKRSQYSLDYVVKKCCHAFLDTSPCAIAPKHAEFQSPDPVMAIPFENITSIYYTALDSRSAAGLTKLLRFLQKLTSSLNEVSICYYAKDKLSLPAIDCRRIKVSVNGDEIKNHNVFHCAYHPHRKLQSLHLDILTYKLVNFSSEITKIISYNGQSLLDLYISLV